METKVPSVVDILSLCRYYRVRSWMDSLYMTEVGFAGGRVDLMVIDLRTFLVYGYEVKVSRRDFLSDDKWHSYVPFFNRFYFAAPRGIIEQSELPPEIGLLECVHNGKAFQLNLAKKAKDIQPCFVSETLGERHLLNVLLGYMRDFNWRHERLIHATCEKCGHLIATRDPRGLPFGVGSDPKHEEERNRRASELLAFANTDGEDQPGPR